jgi:hypothetical protein
MLDLEAEVRTSFERQASRLEIPADFDDRVRQRIRARRRRMQVLGAAAVVLAVVAAGAIVPRVLDDRDTSVLVTDSIGAEPSTTAPASTTSTQPSSTASTQPTRTVAAPARSTAIAGRLANGLPFVLREDVEHGLCVRLGDVDLGCDDVGPVLPRGADQSTARVAVHFFSGNEDGFWLYYGYLPPSASAVMFVLPGDGRWDSGLVIEPTRRYWALPVPSAYTAHEGLLTVVYRDANGAERPAPTR